MSSSKSFLAYAFQRQLVLRSAKIALVVGTVLTLINQYDALLAKRVDVLKLALTYLVPYCVSTYSAVMNSIDRKGAGGGQ